MRMASTGVGMPFEKSHNPGFKYIVRLSETTENKLSKGRGPSI